MIEVQNIKKLNKSVNFLRITNVDLRKPELYFKKSFVLRLSYILNNTVKTYVKKIKYY